LPAIAARCQLVPERNGKAGIVLGTRLAWFIVSLLTLCGIATAVADGPPLEGLWLTQDRGGVVRISPCESGLCGWIVGLDLAPGEAPERDVQGRSHCGLPLITAVQQTGPNEWQGSITNPRDGKTYSARLLLDDAGRLELRGYVLVPLFGSTQIWTRYQGGIAADCRMTTAAS
jgi:uncharacterized protein (DUF2147 family)